MIEDSFLTRTFRLLYKDTLKDIDSIHTEIDMHISELNRLSDELDDKLALKRLCEKGLGGNKDRKKAGE